MAEIRYDIFWWEWKYQISNLLRIKSLCRKWVTKDRILKNKIDSKGYVYVDFTLSHKAKHMLLHRIIASLFISNPENKKEVNHKNWIKTDNRIDNLERCTRSENEKHKYNSLWIKGNMLWKFWKDHNRSKDYIPITERNFMTNQYLCSQ